jgi:hypothetical protein
MMTTRN